MNIEHDTLEYASAAQLSQRLGRSEITSRTLTEHLLERIERHDPKLHAFAAVWRERALEAAGAADARRGDGAPRSAFDGVPVVLKDIIEVAGEVTTGGSLTRDGTVSCATATLARRLEEAGLVVLGKTHTVEFAMGGWGTNRSLGTPWNPWDLDVQRAPGGSSSGTGVAVAAGFAPWGLGTDTGGSVRLPSAWNGLTGLKTTIGRVSCHGVLPLARSLDTPGPLARCVDDAAHLYMLMSGPDRNDPATLAHQPNDPFPAMQLGIEDMHLARLPRAERERADASVLAAYDDALARLKRLGARIVDIDLPMSFANAGLLAGRIIAAEGHAEWGDLVDDAQAPLDDDIRPRLAPGANMSARDYYHALGEMRRLTADFEAALGGADALVMPTAATAAPVVDDIDQLDTPAWYTRPVNVAQGCALALPCGFDNGLPLSLQVVCRGYEEATALRIGRAFEQDIALLDHHPGL